MLLSVHSTLKVKKVVLYQTWETVFFTYMYKSKVKYIEDITRWREDMNFVTVARKISHKWAQRTSGILFVPREHKIHEYLRANAWCSFSQINILLTACLMIFQRFPTTFRRFLKIFQNCSKGPTNVPEHFPKFSQNFRRAPKIVEDLAFEEDPKMFRWYTNEYKYNLRDKVDISEIIASSHERIIIQGSKLTTNWSHMRLDFWLCT